MHPLLMTPVLVDRDSMEAINRETPGSIIRATWFGDEAREPALDAEFMLGMVHAPALLAPGTTGDHELMLARRGTTVSYSQQREAFGWVEQSHWDGRVLIRLTLSDAPSLYDAALAGHHYLFARLWRDRLVPVQITNIVPDPLGWDDRRLRRGDQYNAGRFDAWAVAGQKLRTGESAATNAPAGDRSWYPSAPASTDIGAADGMPCIEALCLPMGSAWARYVRCAHQGEPFESERPDGVKPAIGVHGTQIITSDGVAFIIAGIASMRGGEIVHDWTPRLAQPNDRPSAALAERCLRLQIGVALDNIEHMLSEQALAPGVSERFSLRDVRFLRVRLASDEHADAAREELERRLPGVPTLIVCAQLARPGQLVEIDGAAAKPR